LIAGGGEKSLGDYKGKVVLIENVASLAEIRTQVRARYIYHVKPQ
jgi:glutathione peroxidase-family protein